MRGGQNKTHGMVGRYDRLDSFRDGSLHGPHCLAWESGNRIMLTGDGGAVTLAYQIGEERIREQVVLDYLPNHYGGARLFFLCPGCGRRVRFLYLRWGRFRCRHCGRLNYRSQQQNRDELEPYHKAVKLLRGKFKVSEEQIPVPMDLPGFLPPRPKGMHWSTYRRLLLELDHRKDEYYSRFMAGARRVLGW